MSLTDFARGAGFIFDAMFDKPPFDVRGGLRAAPLTRHYATVGSAFDYALRLLVSKLNRSLVKNYPLVARHGVRGDKRRKEFLASFEQKRKTFLADAIPLAALLPDCIVLAKLESVFRSGKDFPNSEVFDVDDYDVQDLQNLVGLVNYHTFVASHRCILNPTFGQSSLDVGGADADLIIDSTLLEIKTVKSLEFKREYFRQLVGYHILNEREKHLYEGLYDLSIYYSRFGVLFRFPIPGLNNVVWKDKETGEEKDAWAMIESAIAYYRRLIDYG